VGSPALNNNSLLTGSVEKLGFAHGLLAEFGS